MIKPTEVSVCYRKDYKPSLEQQKQDAKQVNDFVKEITKRYPEKPDDKES